MIGRRALLGGVALSAFGASRPRAESDAVIMRKQYVECRYGQLHIHIATPADAKLKLRTPVVCFHPTPASGQYFLAFMKLMATDRIVMSVDTPGYGESDPPPGPVGMLAYAEAVAEGLSSFGYGQTASIDVLAYHTGNFISSELALRQNSPVRRLVMTAIPHYADPARKKAAAAQIRRWTFTEDPKPILDLWDGTVRRRADGVGLRQSIDQFLERLRPGDREWWAYEAVFAYDSAGALPRILQPTVILNPHGALYEQTLAAARIMPRATLVDLADLSHGVFQTGQAIIAKHARAFLDDVPR